VEAERARDIALQKLDSHKRAATRAEQQWQLERQQLQVCFNKVPLIAGDGWTSCNGWLPWRLVLLGIWGRNTYALNMDVSILAASLHAVRFDHCEQPQAAQHARPQWAMELVGNGA
jgi:hypothetical protein